MAGLVAALAFTAVVARAEQDMAAQIAAAKTAAEHQAIAAEYGKQAAAAREEADGHDKMATKYTGHLKDKLHLDTHCQAVSANYRANAKELDTLAEAHRTAAKAAK